MVVDPSQFGRASIKAAIASIVLPPVAAALITLIARLEDYLISPPPYADLPVWYTRCAVVGLGLAGWGLACGLAARRTRTGRVGILLATTGVLAAFLLWRWLGG
jgi:hypothetical protein